MPKDWTRNKPTAFVQMGASNHSLLDREENDFYATEPSAIDDLLKSKEFEKKVNNIVVDTLSDFLESMWTKKSFWKTMLKKK